MATICQLHADLRYYLCLEPVDNNDTEREIRSMVMGKKSYLFCRNDEACHRAALMYSMLGACKVLFF